MKNTPYAWMSLYSPGKLINEDINLLPGDWVKHGEHIYKVKNTKPSRNIIRAIRETTKDDPKGIKGRSYFAFHAYIRREDLPIDECQFLGRTVFHKDSKWPSMKNE